MTRSRLHCVTGTSVDGSVLFLRIGGVDRALKLHTTLFRFANDCNPEGGLGRRITASGRVLPQGTEKLNLVIAATHSVFDNRRDFLASHCRTELLNQPIPNGLPYVFGDVRISGEPKALSIAKITHVEKRLLIARQLHLHNISPLFRKLPFRDSESFRSANFSQGCQHLVDLSLVLDGYLHCGKWRKSLVEALTTRTGDCRKQHGGKYDLPTRPRNHPGNL